MIKFTRPLLDDLEKKIYAELKVLAGPIYWGYWFTLKAKMVCQLIFICSLLFLYLLCLPTFGSGVDDIFRQKVGTIVIFSVGGNVFLEIIEGKLRNDLINYVNQILKNITIT